MTIRPSRRDILLAFAAATATGCGLPREAGPASPQFPLGVACGDVSVTSGDLWTAFEGTGPLTVRVWPRDDETSAQTFDVTLDDARIGTALVRTLSADTAYAYQFSGDGVLSDVGLFRTPPTADTLKPLTFGVASCARQTEPLAPLAVVAERYPLDALLYLGDTVYADGAKTLADYRGKWREALARRPQRLIRGATSVVATWDDHEVINDASGDRLDPSMLGAARTAFFEYQPVRPDAPTRLWRSLRWGKTAELFVLDCRGERNHATREYMSREQLDWLKAGLAASDATFKLILNSVPISSYPGALFGAFSDDRWEGWPSQREELIDFVDANTSGVLWLTGDFHMGVAGRVARTGPGSTQVEIAAGPAGSNLANPALSYPSPPQFDFASSINNMVVLDLDPATRAARVRFIASNDRVLFDHTYVV